MNFLWKKTNFISSQYQITRGRPKKLPDNTQITRLPRSHNIKEQYLCPNIYTLYMQKYITKDHLKIACEYHKIAHSAINALIPSTESILGRATSPRSSVFEISIKKDKIINKYYRIRGILSANNKKIDDIIEKAVVKNIKITTSVSDDVMRTELLLLKNGLDLIYEYLEKDFYNNTDT